MGQYFIPTLFETKKQFSKENVIGVIQPHASDNGMKLTEHSYFGNEVVETVINIVCKHKKLRVAWVGDYADNIRRNGEAYSLYNVVRDMESVDYSSKPSNKKWMLNNTKRQCVNLENYPRKYQCKEFFIDEKGKIVSKMVTEDMLHPLPILTCMGNYRGGGDYFPKLIPYDSAEYIGSWAGDVISFSDKEPNDTWEDIMPRFYHPTFDLITYLIQEAKQSIEYVK